MRQRAEKSLKAYKRTQEGGNGTRLVNQAIEIIRNKNALQYKWEEFWNAIEENKKQFPSAPGEDDGER